MGKSNDGVCLNMGASCRCVLHDMARLSDWGVFYCAFRRGRSGHVLCEGRIRMNKGDIEWLING